MGKIVYYLRVLSIIYFKQKKTRYIQHIYIQIKSFKQYQNYQKFNWTLFKHHVEDLIFYRPHFTNVHTASMRQTNILLRQYWMPTDSSCLKKIKTTQITLTCKGISASSLNNVITLSNETNHPKSLTII